jgi:hypothetical protein
LFTFRVGYFQYSSVFNPAFDHLPA